MLPALFSVQLLAGSYGVTLQCSLYHLGITYIFFQMLYLDLYIIKPLTETEHKFLEQRAVIRSLPWFVALFSEIFGLWRFMTE